VTEQFRYRISIARTGLFLPVRVSLGLPRGSLVIAIKSPLVGNLTRVSILEPQIPLGLTFPRRALRRANTATQCTLLHASPGPRPLIGEDTIAGRQRNCGELDHSLRSWFPQLIEWPWRRSEARLTQQASGVIKHPCSIPGYPND
jgi:hypothetical protein